MSIRLSTGVRSVIRRQRGIGMVEALVALVVLSAGMLGIASLYVTTLKASRTAILRTQAVYLVSDMLDRIRANAPARAAYDLDTYSGNPTTHNCVGVLGADNCSIQELAEDDLKRWIDAVKEALPTTQKADVQFTAATGGGLDTYDVSITWTEPSSNETYSYAARMQLVPVTP